ncbi:MAG: hypothetical protein U5K76_01360 [Woeseiaceae bacterium]|nr:hypothetical protein [Woeseiaceae bacterium]
MAVFIAGPVAGFDDQTRRAELTDLAENALRRVARDVRRALPNSVRVTSSGALVAVEMLNTVDGVRYREQPPPAGADKQLDFSTADGAFNSVGPFTQIQKPFSSTGHYLSIYNVGVPGANAYELANVITPPGTRIDIDSDAAPGEDNVRLTPAFRSCLRLAGAARVPGATGPGQLLPVRRVAAGTLRRYDGYAITTSHADRDSHAELLAAGAGATLITNRVESCSASYASGTAQRAGLVTLAMAVAETGERVSLLHQVHVSNVP